VSLIYAARRRVVLTTPYFVPDATLLAAMRTVAARGAEVHLIVSQHSNKPLVQFAQQSYSKICLPRGCASTSTAAPFCTPSTLPSTMTWP
jgi:cardiolipin synthase